MSSASNMHQDILSWICFVSSSIINVNKWALNDNPWHKPMVIGSGIVSPPIINSSCCISILIFHHNWRLPLSKNPPHCLPMVKLRTTVKLRKDRSMTNIEAPPIENFRSKKENLYSYRKVFMERPMVGPWTWQFSSLDWHIISYWGTWYMVYGITLVGVVDIADICRYVQYCHFWYYLWFTNI